jgi:DNA-binding transcriptional LysR family regulator
LRPVDPAPVACVCRSGHIPDVNLTRLRMLSEIGARGSFSAAASALDYTPSAVSQQIALLEREAGIRLVDRGPRGACLTDAGRLLVRHADVALLELAKARRALAALSSTPATHLRVAAFPTATATIVALAARSFAEEQADASVQVLDAEPDAAEGLLTRRRADVAVLYDYEASGGEDVIWREPVFLCLPAGHRRAATAEVDLADLAGEAWFGGDGCPWAPSLVEQCRAAGFTPAFSPLLTHDYAAMQGLVATHGLVGLIPALALEAPHPGVVIRRLQPAPRARRLRYAASDPSSPVAQRFRNHLTMAVVRRRHRTSGIEGGDADAPVSRGAVSDPYAITDDPGGA